MIRVATRLVLAAALAAGATVFAPVAGSQVPSPVQPPVARPDDVKSVDAIIAALYASISGKVGEKRDWNRMRSLFTPEGRLMPLAPQPTGGVRPVALSVDDYIVRSGPRIEEMGFAEREIARRTEEYGSLVHVWSTYAGGGSAPTAPPPIRGINSIQLYNDGQRWWIVSVFWLQERPGTPLPAKYLPGGS
jgi:hypothetical protein